MTSDSLKFAMGIISFILAGSFSRQGGLCSYNLYDGNCVDPHNHNYHEKYNANVVD